MSRQKPSFAVHSYPWYVSDWTESETRLDLNLSERGLYRELLDRCYKEGSIPDDEKKLIVMCACDPREFRRSWPKVRACFDEYGQGRLSHRRVDAVLQRLEKWNESRRKGGFNRQRSSSAKAEIKPAKAEVKPRKTYGNTTTTTSTSTSTATASPTPTERCEFDPDVVNRRIQDRHPRKDKPYLFEQCFADVLSRADDPAALAAEIDARHESWCLWWRKEYSAVKFWPALAAWMADGTYTRYPPGMEPKTEEPTCTECSGFGMVYSGTRPASEAGDEVWEAYLATGRPCGCGAMQ